ncbi:MAG: RHS repeat-associated core domain-containing protein, partial [Candidatus Acidiferrales bacterium]
DWLGSSRFASTPSRALYYDGAYGPFGELYAQTGTADASFTGMNQDTVANLYDFPAREYGTQGRWRSPDPSGISAVRPTDPRTWNRYAYVRNNPLAAVDPQGLVDVMPGSLIDGAMMFFMTCGGAGCPSDQYSQDSPDFSVAPTPTSACPDGTCAAASSNDPAQCGQVGCNADSNGGFCFDNASNPTACGSDENPNQNATCWSAVDAPCGQSSVTPFISFFQSMTPSQQYLWNIQIQFGIYINNPITPCAAAALALTASAVATTPTLLVGGSSGAAWAIWGTTTSSAVATTVVCP